MDNFSSIPSPPKMWHLSHLSHPRDQWPRHLWRVTHSGTNTIAHPKDPQQRKLIAAAALHEQNASYDQLLTQIDVFADLYLLSTDLFPFLDMVKNHITWDRASMTWFVSTFSDGEHARNWANLYIRLGKMDVTVYKIDTTKLPARTRLFSIKTLDGLFNLNQNLKPKQKTTKHEMLVFGRIPEEAIVDVYNLMDAATTPGMYCLLLGAVKLYVTDGRHSEDDNGNFFIAGECTDENADENLNDGEISIRADMLSVAEYSPEGRVYITDKSGNSHQRFWAPVVVARHFECSGPTEIALDYEF